jgi:2-oxoglutarate ferredoxin oxidoreductase subunit alpha
VNTERKLSFIDGSKLITEALVQSGADMFVGYPITPSNRFYEYGQKRFPQFLPAPDEISVVQWMAGAAAMGKLPVTATAFPGLALMVESINMAYAMELPMVIIVTQRLGPSTGFATIGAQGDLSLVNGIIPGFPLPTFCPSDFEDCWNLSHKALLTAVSLRTPVILLTSKEMVMTNRSFDMTLLEELSHVKHAPADLTKEYKSYESTPDLVPPFLSLKNSTYQVRINASMHNQTGKIVKNDESLSVTKRLAEKIMTRATDLAHFTYAKQADASKLIITYGVSAFAVRDAIKDLELKGEKVSYLILKTLIPISAEVKNIITSYTEVIIVEENLNGQLKEMLFGKMPPNNVRSITSFGKMISPSEIALKTH